MPSTALQPSKVLTGFAGLHEASQRDPRAGQGGSPQQGSSFPEVPTSLQLKCQQWVKSFQWTVKQHLHNKTAALFPNQKLASLYRGNCVPKHESQLIWKFILVFSNLPVCQYSMSANMLDKNKQYWQFLHAKNWHTKRKAAAKKLLNRCYTKDNKIEMYQA